MIEWLKGCYQLHFEVESTFVFITMKDIKIMKGREFGGDCLVSTLVRGMVLNVANSRMGFHAGAWEPAEFLQVLHALHG
jgi:hypothetical protein